MSEEGPGPGEEPSLRELLRPSDLPPAPDASKPASPEAAAHEKRIQRRINLVGTLEIVFGVTLLLLLAAPWVDVPAYGKTYGYELPTVLHAFDKLEGNLQGNQKSNVNPFLLIYLLPIFCVALMVRELRGSQAHTLAGAAAAVPVAAIAYALGVAGAQVLPLLMPAAWAAIGFSVLLTWLALYGVQIGYPHDRALRARMRIGILMAAVPICYVMGWINR